MFLAGVRTNTLATFAAWLFYDRHVLQILTLIEQKELPHG
jgi:hypothetical protein